MKKTIVWFRKDLRLHDHPALWHASKKGLIIPVFIWSNEDEKFHQPNEASRWWLHHSLISLQNALQHEGLPFIIRKGNYPSVLMDLVRETGAEAVYFNKRYEPFFAVLDRKVVELLEKKQIEVRSFHSELLFNPDVIWNQNGEPYKVFTSFSRRALKESVNLPLSHPEFRNPIKTPIHTLTIEHLSLLPTFRWDQKLYRYWTPGEQSAINRWEEFVETSLLSYKKKRDFPAVQSVSGLSPFLSWGNISSKALWHAVERFIIDHPSMADQAEAFKRQLIWRDFCYHQLIHYPNITQTPLREAYQLFPWIDHEEDFFRWKKGLTGYPMIDAGMRELWETGVMHNRVRMVAASFLVKHLLIPWVKGCEWFQSTLIDYDMANNAANWQWIVGSGFDASPYFRIFNPVTQSEKFDPDAHYIYKWIPELENLPVPYVHHPWTAPSDILKKANIELGKTYPYPLVEHAYARQRALNAYKVIK